MTKDRDLSTLACCTNRFTDSEPVSVGIKVRDNESIDRALRRFKRAVNRSRVLRIYRGNMAYVKPSEERRLAKEKALRNARKRNRYY
ncbi:MAG: 30S ribosomal protein S21 [Rhodothermales bacterium]|nr:30S ribosomal protein S21 [Rhodothermales bacterium]